MDTKKYLNQSEFDRHGDGCILFFIAPFMAWKFVPVSFVVTAIYHYYNNLQVFFIHQLR